MRHLFLYFIFSAISIRLDESAHQDLGFVSVNPKTNRLIDQYGREVYFHGVNAVYKIPPYAPRTDAFDPVHSLVEEDMQTLSRLGLNVIRLGLMWPGAEPERGRYNESYYETIRSIVDTAYKHDIYTILDLHQDVLSEEFCGEGVPAWAVESGDGIAFPFPLSAPYNHTGTRPTPEQCARHTWSDYYITEEVGIAFEKIYKNSNGLLDSLATFWKKSASEFKDHASVIGYELMNEPWLGDFYHHPSYLDPFKTDQENLSPAYDKISSAIREVDTEHIIMFESVTWADLGTGFKEVPGGDEYQNRSVLSYHYYFPPDMPDVDEQFQVRMGDLAKLKCGGFLTEYLMCGSDVESLNKLLDTCDKYKQSWTGWMYKLYGNITGDCGALFDAITGEFDQKKAKSLSRTYPQVVAGEVESISFNTQDYEFNLVYRTSMHIPNTVTQIYLNAKLGYWDTPIVAVTTEIKYKVNISENIVLIEHEQANNATIRVNITPP